MVKLKLSLILVGVLLLFGCSSTSTITKVDTIYVYQPALIDTIQLYDSLLINDSTWYGKIRDSLDNEIGELTVYWKKKLASVSLNQHIDTVLITQKDTIKSTTVLETVSGFLNWWEEAIVLMVAILLLTWKAKRKLPIV